MQSPAASTVALVVLSPFVAWRVYSRFRRSIGRQRLSLFFQRVTLAIFAIVTLVLAYASRNDAASLEALAGGLAAGCLLGLYGLRLTRFEPTPQGLYYTPNAPLGIALSVLFLGRITQRLIAVYTISTATGPSHPPLVRSPLTLAVFGLLAGYYIAYAAGLLRRGSDLPAGELSGESLAPDA